ncbi:MAG: hypothetical protein Fur0022_26050 [Anaerolineales bacterium]
MNLRFPVVSTFVAVISGLAVLFLYVSPLFVAGVDWQSTLLKWATTLSTVALVIGLINLASVHSRKLDMEGDFPFNSLVLVIAMVVTFGLVLVFGPASDYAMFILNYIQIPVETSLVAILAVTLVYASARVVRRKTDAFSLVFIATAIFILLTTSPLVTDWFPSIGEPLLALRDWITNVLATAGARGILLGIALGTIATGIRILMGMDRPYGG